MIDAEFAISILPRVSRTFALSIEALPEPLRSTIRVTYLLCRIVDTIEDDPDLPHGRRQELFSMFSRVVGCDDAPFEDLERAFRHLDGTDDRALCQNLGAPVRLFRSLPRHLIEAARPHVLEMAEGMAKYARRWQGPEALTVLRDQRDLEEYCFYVAGTVGNLLTAVFLATHDELGKAHREGLIKRSISFGLGLQMTNIVKDVTDDHVRGWCFLPKTLCDRQGVAPEELTNPEKREESMEVVRDVVKLARRHLDEAQEYTVLVPKEAQEVRLFVLVPLVLALATLALVERSPAVLVPGESVKVSRGTVSSVLRQARAVVQDDEGIKALCAGARALELGDSKSSGAG